MIIISFIFWLKWLFWFINFKLFLYWFIFNIAAIPLEFVLNKLKLRFDLFRYLNFLYFGVFYNWLLNSSYFTYLMHLYLFCFNSIFFWHKAFCLYLFLYCILLFFHLLSLWFFEDILLLLFLYNINFLLLPWLLIIKRVYLFLFD